MDETMMPVIFILLQNAIYGFGDPISKSSYERFSVFSILCARFCLAFLVIMIFFARKVVSELRAKNAVPLILPSAFVSLTYIVGNVALIYSAATTVSFLRSFSTIITPILSVALFGKKYRLKNVAVLACVLFGMYLLCGFGGLSRFGIGEILALLSAFFMALSLVFSKKAVEEFSAMTLTATQCAFLSVFSFACMIGFDKKIGFFDFDLQALAVVAYLSIFCTVAAYILQNLALKKISASAVSLIQCACPVVTAVFSYFVLGETLSALGVLGAALILIGVVFETLFSLDEERGK